MYNTILIFFELYFLNRYFQGFFKRFMNEMHFSLLLNYNENISFLDINTIYSAGQFISHCKTQPRPYHTSKYSSILGKRNLKSAVYPKLRIIQVLVG